MNFGEMIFDSCLSSPTGAPWSMQHAPATKISEATAKNTQLHPSGKSLQKRDKMSFLMKKSNEFWRNDFWFMLLIAHRCSLIHASCASNQNRWSNSQKHTIAPSCQKSAKKGQNVIFDCEVTWILEKWFLIHVCHRPQMLPDPCNIRQQPKSVKQQPKTHNCTILPKVCKKGTKCHFWLWSHMNFGEMIFHSCRPSPIDASWSV